MTRLPFPDLGAAPERVRQIIERFPYDLAVMRMFAHAHGAFEGWLRMNSAVIGRSDLDPVVIELAICVTAFSDSPNYEYAHHRPVALQSGVTAEQLDAIERRSYDGRIFSTRHRAVVVFCDEVVRNVKAADKTFAELRRHFTDRQVVELILLVGQYMLNSRVAENTGVTMEDDAQFAKPTTSDPVSTT